MKKVLRLMIVLGLVFVAACGLSIGVAAGDSIATAEEISFGDMNYGQMTESHTKDMYEFKVPSSGCVTIDVTAYIYITSYYLYDENGNEVWQVRRQYWNSNTEEYKISWQFHLLKGTYYLAICSDYSNTGNYQFKTSFKTSSESFTETLDNTNNSIREADKISLGKSYKGQLALNDDKDLYKFTLSSSGCVTIDVTAHIYITSYYLYDENGNEVWQVRRRYWNSNTEEYKISWQFHLLKGTYYLAICSDYSSVGNYQFKTSFKTSSESFTETLDNTNNSIREADKISLGKTYKGQSALNDDKDLYKFTVASSGCVTLDVTAYIYITSYYLYDENGNEVWHAEWQYWNDTNKSYAAKYEWTLDKGTYYLAICREDGNGNYTFSIKCNHQWKTKSITKATLTKNGKVTYICNCCKAVSSKTVYQAASFKLSSTSYTYDAVVRTPTVTVKDSKGNTISSSNYTVTYASGRKNVGTYKVTIKMKGNYTGTKSLSFKINPINMSKFKISLSKTSYTYTGNTKKPAVTVINHNGTKLNNVHYTVTYASGRKNVGTYKVTIKMKGNYTGTKTLTFKINPAKTTVSKLTAGKKSLKVAITKKSTQVTGYEIQYSTSKSFKSYKTKKLTSYKKTSLTLTGLSAKRTYYVRVRTYKTVNGKRYCSGWSTYKYKKTK